MSKPPDWDAKFTPPLRLPDGRELKTLREAGEFVAALPEKTQRQEIWQRAAGYLLRAATEQFAWEFFARIAILSAINGPREPPIGKEPGVKKKDAWKERRKARKPL